MNTHALPRIFSIEGNIGAGKTTLLERIEAMKCPNIYVLREPVDAWSEVRDDNDGENILEKFYKDPKRYAFSFQVLAFHTRLHALKNLIQNNVFDSDDIILCERSLHADGHIFAKMLYDDGKLDEISYKIYQKMYLDGIEEFPLAGIFYLDVEPETCAERIVKRGRTGEESIPIEYLQRCHAYHRDWLTAEQPYPVVPYTDIDTMLKTLLDR